MYAPDVRKHAVDRLRQFDAVDDYRSVFISFFRSFLRSFVLSVCLPSTNTTTTTPPPPPPLSPPLPATTPATGCTSFSSFRPFAGSTRTLTTQVLALLYLSLSLTALPALN